ncbi:MAG: beta galactosidase jelly roll domain-containing protein [Reichenbachiella sp.]
MNIFKLFIVIFLMISSDLFAQRNEEISLDGTWQIIFDDENVGRTSDWMFSDNFESNQTKRAIRVPSCWEETKEDYEGVAFYRRKFNVPKEWSSKMVHLSFEAVNYIAQVYINDKVVGYHEGGFTPFEFNIEHLLNFEEENTLTLRVVGPVTMSDKVIDGIGKMETPQWRGAYTGGIWQSVRLFTTGKTLFKDIFIEPNIENNTAKINLEIENKLEQNQEIEIDLAIVSRQSTQDEVANLKKLIELLPGSNNFEFTLDIKDAVYWSPDTPHLYQLNASISKSGQPQDQREVSFGLREFTVKNGKFYFNNKPFYLKATFFEGLYPVRLAYPDSREMAIREIQLAKEAGFNMIRPWRRPAPPMWLDLADSLGVLTVGSMAFECMLKPEESPYLAQRVENEIRESILKDRNRASIVQWELFNELHRPILINMLHPMSLLARELDPTRMILDESGGWANGANLYLPYKRTAIKFNDIHHYPGPNINQFKFDSFLAIGNTKEENNALEINAKPPGRNVIPGLLSYPSELGYGSLPDLEQNIKDFEELGNPITPPYKYHKQLHKEMVAALQETGIAKIYTTASDFYKEQQRVHGLANYRMIEGVRSNPKVGGYCIHALTAGDWIIGAGLLDIWRNPKGDAYYKTKAANNPQLAVLRVLPRNAYADKGTSIEITGVNELAAQSATLRIEIRDGENKEVYKKFLEVKLDSGITSIFKDKLNTSTMNGIYNVEVILNNKNGTEIASSKRDFFVSNEIEKSVESKKIAVLDQEDELSNFLKSKGFNIEQFGDNTNSKTLVIVGTKKVKDQQYTAAISRINQFVSDGGKAIFLEVPGKEVKRTGPRRSYQSVGKSYLPSDPILKRSIGLWDGILHIVHEHPIFEGLPVNIPMISLYENIAPTSSMMSQKGEIAVNTIAFDRFLNADDFKRNYIGPGKVWWATDVVIVPHEKGEMLLSTLNLLRNLGKDPVADVVLMNMIKVM